MLQYRKTPDRGTHLSPAMCVFGRSIRDFIPIHPGKYSHHKTWRETLANREEALRNRHMRICERLSEHTRHLPALIIGDCVMIQNQTGHYPNKWDNTGIVIEVRQFDQYVVRVDGSGRVTLRNRKFLRKYVPVIDRAPIIMLPHQNIKIDPPIVLNKPVPVPISQLPITVRSKLSHDAIPDVTAPIPLTPNNASKSESPGSSSRKPPLDRGHSTTPTKGLSKLQPPTSSLVVTRRSSRYVKPPTWMVDYDTT